MGAELAVHLEKVQTLPHPAIDFIDSYLDRLPRSPTESELGNWADEIYSPLQAVVEKAGRQRLRMIVHHLGTLPLSRGLVAGTFANGERKRNWSNLFNYFEETELRNGQKLTHAQIELRRDGATGKLNYISYSTQELTGSDALYLRVWYHLDGRYADPMEISLYEEAEGSVARDLSETFS